MITQQSRARRSHRRRAVVAVQVAVFSLLLLSMAAITIDVGVLYNTRADLQRAADAAALAGATSYTTDTMMRVRMGTGGSTALSDVIRAAQLRAGNVAYLNATFAAGGTGLSTDDLLSGWINLQSGTEAIRTNPSPRDYNAFQVTVRRDSGESGSPNGPVRYYFAPVFGQTLGELSATAVAVFDDRYSSVTVASEFTDIMPFTIHRDALSSELADGGDSYGYDDASDTILYSADGIREVRIYPYPLSGSGYTEGDGNFGVLNIGTGNQGVDAEEVQILNGVAPSDFEMEIGTSELTFHDDSGSVTYDITGSPGMESSLKASISQVVGEVVGFFVHDNVILSGSNAVYTITELRYGRVMDVRLTGPPHQRGVFIQPVSYVGSEITIDPSAPSSGGLVGRLVLAR